MNQVFIFVQKNHEKEKGQVIFALSSGRAKFYSLFKASVRWITTT
jgi:hypothetical protein